MQKTRIDAVISETYGQRQKQVPHFGVSDKLGFFFNKIIRWVIKVPQRISRWPYKIRKRLKSLSLNDMP